MIAVRTMAMMNMILKPVLILRPCLFALTASMMKRTIDASQKMHIAMKNAQPNMENIGPK